MLEQVARTTVQAFADCDELDVPNPLGKRQKEGEGLKPLDVVERVGYAGFCDESEVDSV